MISVPTPHRWRFFRSGGFDQVRIETVEDLRALPQLDLKLWASLACPADGLEFDARTLKYIDTDGDGRIRAPEILAAVEWALSRLSQPQVLFQTPGLPLDAIATGTADGEQLLRSARRILVNLDKPDTTQITEADTADLSRLFPPGQVNGDGCVPASLTNDPELRALIQDILTVCEGCDDRSGERAVRTDDIGAFFEQAAGADARRTEGIGAGGCRPQASL